MGKPAMPSPEVMHTYPHIIASVPTRPVIPKHGRGNLRQGRVGDQKIR